MIADLYGDVTGLGARCVTAAVAALGVGALVLVTPGAGVALGLGGPVSGVLQSSPVDSIAELRSLRDRALTSGDPELAVAAVRLSLNAASHERVASFLALEQTLRGRGEAAMADSALLHACSWDCASVSTAPQRLHALLAEELAVPDGKRRVTQAVRALLGAQIRPSLPTALQNRLALPIDSEPAVRTAAEDSDTAGRPQVAAELWDALAYALLPSRRYVGGYADASAALSASRRALGLRRAAGNRAAEAMTRSSMAMAALRANQRGQVDSVAAWNEAAYRLSEEAPEAVRALILRRSAVISAAAGQPAEAERLVDRAISLHGEPASREAAWHRLFVARELADASAGDAALRQSRQAYGLLREADVPPALRARDALVHAEAHRLNPATDSAVHFFRAAGGLFLSAGDEARAAASHLAAAEHAFEHGRHSEVEPLAAGAAAAIERVPGGAAGLRARLLNLQGMIAFIEDEWGAARANFEAARAAVDPSQAEWYEAERYLAVLDIAEERPQGVLVSPSESRYTWRNTPGFTVSEPPRADDRPLTQGLTHTFAAMRHLGRADLTRGTEELRSALQLLERAGHYPSLRRAQGVAGLLFAQLGRPDSANHYLRLAGDLAPAHALSTGLHDLTHPEGPAEALRARVRGTSPAEGLRMLESQLVESRASQDRIAEARVLEVLGYWYFRRRTPSDPGTATTYYDSAASVLHAIPQHRLDDWQRVQLAEQFTRLREESVLAWLARSDELGASRAAFGSAAAGDRGRSLAFEWLSGLRSGMFAQILDVFGASAGSPLPEVGAELYEVPFEYRPADALPRVTISYLTAADTLLTWVHVTGGGEATRLRVIRRPLTADSLAVLVGQIRAALGIDEGAARGFGGLESAAADRGIGFRTAGSVEAALAGAAAILLPPELMEGLPARAEVLIIPFGPISTVPFAALPLAAGAAPLGSRFPVRYLPSLTAQRWNVRRAPGVSSLPSAPGEGGGSARAAWLERAVVLGNPTMPTIQQVGEDPLRLTQLPGAGAEADAIAELLGIRPLKGDEATLAALRARAGTATVVHLATHGFAYGSEERVADSFVALAPHHAHDGVLTVAQLLSDAGFRFHSADLVVLSACQTGLGQLTASEGTLGLQRAFLAAGARSALVSLWNVSDEATNVLMQSFYREWLGGASKDEALRRAQQEVRGEPESRFHHPRFWAAFQLVGDR